MAILLRIASVWVSSIQIMQVRVQNKGKCVWKSRYDGDVSCGNRHELGVGSLDMVVGVALTTRAQVKGYKVEPLLLYTDMCLCLFYFVF